MPASSLSKSKESPIDKWLTTEDSWVRTELFAYAAAHPVTPRLIHAWLSMHGLTTTLQAVGVWMRTNNIRPGSKAQEMHDRTREFVGIRETAVLESLAVRMIGILERILERIENALEDSADDPASGLALVGQLPQLVGQAKSLLESTRLMRERDLNHATIGAGAHQLAELILADASVRGQPEEEWIKAVILNAMEKLNDKVTGGK